MPKRKGVPSSSLGTLVEEGSSSRRCLSRLLGRTQNHHVIKRISTFPYPREGPSAFPDLVNHRERVPLTLQESAEADWTK